MTKIGTCAICGASFTYERKRRPVSVCSPECARERKRRVYAPKNRAAYYARHGTSRLNRIEKTCIICGNCFDTYDSRTATCGRSCGGRLSSQKSLGAGTHASLTRKPGLPASDRWRLKGARRRARIRSSFERFVASEIFDRDRWRCGICGKKIDKRRSWPDPMCATLDHIIPLSEGGAHSRANTQAAHLICNSRKGNGPGGQLRLFG
jgi:5-methylcytosine-specific restriction endonuclease McrA